MAKLVAKRTGGGDGDGLRPMTAAQVKEALANYKAGAFKYCQSSAEQKEQLEMISMMREWADTFEKYKRIGCKKMTLGSYRAGRLLSVAALQIEWRGFPERDVRMVVRLLALNPMHDKRIVGFEMMESLKALGRDNALLLDCSALREVPCLRVFALGSIRTLDADPELVDPRKLFYKSHVKRTCFVLDNIPEWADLGPFWFEGTTHDGVSFWFRKRTPMLLNEFEISWDHPKAGNATGSGTVGGARVIGIGELDQCKDIKGWAKPEKSSTMHMEEDVGEDPEMPFGGGGV
ncbi:hypothetical protein JKP88DRAFT_323058 [Tribonema minus]|uniref:Uncharacterized protein n=1 Tax=Tribonema minus TaxID=303371 RepID=A0A835YSI1_9STRA|nr:hypothetical protein JKP88DRAFT_323058 [Tribonema minus]